MSGSITQLIDFLVNLMSSLGYFGVFLGMLIESSFLPFPSELILPPAGVLIARGEFSTSLVLFFAILGSLAGALLNYGLALHFGRRVFKKLVNRYGKIFFLKKEHLEKSEVYFKKHGQITTFTGRLIPGIRQIISIPAGFSKMHLPKFIFFTALGSGIWSATLIYAGFVYGDNQNAINSLLNSFTFLIIVFLTLIIFAYIYLMKKSKSLSHR